MARGLSKSLPKLYNKKCPPGVFCIENITLMVLGIFLLIGGLFLFQYVKGKSFGDRLKNPMTRETPMMRQQEDTKHTSPSLFGGFVNMLSPFYTSPSAIWSNDSKDTYLNPYAPPLRQNPYFDDRTHYDVRGYLPPPITTSVRHHDVVSVVPINVNTRHRNYAYKQVGILTRDDGSETILPLFGRPLDNGRDKWQYYTMKDGQNMVKLPVSRNGKSCTNEYGCDEIFNGDSLYIEGYKDNFNAVIYETDEPRYIPL
jgi:hypothetical protein